MRVNFALFCLMAICQVYSDPVPDPKNIKEFFNEDVKNFVHHDAKNFAVKTYHDIEPIIRKILRNVGESFQKIIDLSTDTLQDINEAIEQNPDAQKIIKNIENYYQDIEHLGNETYQIIVMTYDENAPEEMKEMIKAIEDTYLAMECGYRNLNPTQQATIKGLVVGAGVTASAYVFLPVAGFTASGIRLGSSAAEIQSVVYGANTGGLFSVLQSTGATMTASSVAGSVAAGGAAGGAVGAAIGDNQDGNFTKIESGPENFLGRLFQKVEMDCPEIEKRSWLSWASSGSARSGSLKTMVITLPLLFFL